MMEHCIFCKIVKGEIDSAKVYENQNVVAFLDVNPLTRGHCLVVPKNHFENIFDIEENVLQQVISAGKNISTKVRQSLHADGIRLSQSNGQAAGQVISHFHLHIIPRYADDGVQMSDHGIAHPPKVDMSELKKLAEMIKEAT